MNFLRHKYIYLGFSFLLVLASVVVIAVWGLKLGIDFTGGSLLEVEFEKTRPETSLIREGLQNLDLGAVVAQPTGERGIILRFQHTTEETHQEILKRLEDLSGGDITELRFNTIGPTIGRELQRRSLLAIGFAIVAIVLYVAFAFRKVSKPISSWKYGVVTIFALVHDVVIPTGIFAVLGKFRGVEVDSLFVTALLTILGFSVHDTIVVFDRIRENLHKLKSPEPFELTVNHSMRETMARSINTSFTVLLVIGAVIFFGGSTTTYFAFTLAVGIIFGTYSSIFVASPLLAVWERLGSRKKGGFF